MWLSSGSGSLELATLLAVADVVERTVGLYAGSTDTAGAGAMRRPESSTVSAQSSRLFSPMSEPVRRLGGGAKGARFGRNARLE